MHSVSDFRDALGRLLGASGLSLHELARRSHYDVGYLSKVINGHKHGSRDLALVLDKELDAGGVLVDAWDRSARPLTRVVPSSRAVEALRVAMGSDDAAGIDSVRNGLTELVTHYAQVVPTASSMAVYDELVSVRSFAGSLLGRGGSAQGQRSDIVVMSGWLSSLLAIAATDAGDHAAALVWCSDTERCGREARFPELLGWAALTRALIAYYQGDPRRSADAARRGQAAAPRGTAAYVKLAAQEMRSLAMLGDGEGTLDARHRAVAAMDQLGASSAMTGVYSIPRADDPPYTATSLLLARRYEDAAETTRRLIETAYPPQSRVSRDQPTTYARTLLILGLAVAGLGEAEEAAAAGMAALECGRVVWPTVVLAGKLDRSLALRAPGTRHAADYHAHYAEAARRLALPQGSSARPSGGQV
jgi:hypothetical protein